MRRTTGGQAFVAVAVLLAVAGLLVWAGGG